MIQPIPGVQFDFDKPFENYEVRRATIYDADRLTQFHVQKSLKLNPLWRSFDYNLEELYDDYLPRIKCVIQDNLSMLITKKQNNEIVFFVAQIDAFSFLYYYSQFTFPKKSKIIQYQSTLDDRMENKFIVKDQIIQRGHSLIQVYISISEEFAGQNMTTLLFLMLDQYTRGEGYRYFYARSTNMTSAIKAIAYGADVLDQVQIQNQKGELVPAIWFLERDFTKIPPGKVLMEERTGKQSFKLEYGDSLIEKIHLIRPKL